MKMNQTNNVTDMDELAKELNDPFASALALQDIKTKAAYEFKEIATNIVQTGISANLFFLFNASNKKEIIKCINNMELFYNDFGNLIFMADLDKFFVKNNRCIHLFKTTNKVWAHLFCWLPDRWNIFYFRLTDIMGAYPTHEPHWVNGYHLHYSSNFFLPVKKNKYTEANKIWKDLDVEKYPTGEHIKYCGYMI